MAERTAMASLDCDIITFDCYGTLIDWESGIVGAFQSEAARHGVTIDASSIVAAYMSQEPVVEAERYSTYREVLGETARRVGIELGLQ
jgi:2-haloacid dehalogenase